MRVAASLSMSLSLLLLGSASTKSLSADPKLPDSESITLATVLVTGDQPGPGLWRVSRGDHQMWVLGTVLPLPRRMRWNSDEVIERIAESGAVLWAPSLTVDADIGRIRSLLLVPALLKARRNPDGDSLRAIVPPDLYQRWQVLKARYMPGERAIERWRPLFAAQKLYEQAVRNHGMRLSGVVYPDIERAARRNDVPVVRPKVTIQIDAPRQTLREFSSASLDDLECFRLTIEHLEADLRNLVLRANAWAEGDIDGLRSISLVDQVPACIEAVLNTSVLSEPGAEGLPQRIRAQWLADAERVLDEHVTSFAVLPMRLVVANDGFLSALRERGYRIEAPDEFDSEYEPEWVPESDPG